MPLLRGAQGSCHRRRRFVGLGGVGALGEPPEIHRHLPGGAPEARPPLRAGGVGGVRARQRSSSAAPPPSTMASSPPPSSAAPHGVAAIFRRAAGRRRICCSSPRGPLHPVGGEAVPRLGCLAATPSAGAAELRRAGRSMPPSRPWSVSGFGGGWGRGDIFYIICGSHYKFSKPHLPHMHCGCSVCWSSQTYVAAVA